MIEELTTDQEKQIEIYREKYFKLATCTDPADRPRAEKAARRMAEIGGVKISEVTWFMSPKKCGLVYDVGWNPLRNSLRNSLWNSLQTSLWNSLQTSLWDSLWNSLQTSLWDSLWNSLRDSLRGSLRNSLQISLWDSGRLCFYSYAIEVLGIECDSKTRKLLDVYNEIAASCFAIWILPGKIILCERPETVKIKKGRLVGLTWRKEKEGK